MIDYSSPREQVIEHLETLGITVKANICRCPSPYHEDKKASASILDKNGHCRVYCHVCNERWDLSDLQGRTQGKEHPTEAPKTQTEIAAWLKKLGHSHKYFKYTDASGSPILYECRFIPHKGPKKDYRPFYPVDRGYRIGKPFTPYVLYNLPEVLKATMVVICEGPKSADAVKAADLVGTTGPFGAGKASSTDFEPLKGKNVILWADNDPAGLKHMLEVEQILTPLGCKVGHVDVTKMPLKGDAADITPEEVLEMVDAVSFLTPANEYAQHNELIFTGKIKSCPVPDAWTCFADIAQPFIPQTVTVMHGMEGGGKSFFMIQLIRAMLAQGVKPAYLALEMPRNVYVDRLLAQQLDMPELTRLAYKEDPGNRATIEKVMSDNEDFINSHMKHIHTARNGLMTTEDVCLWAEGRPSSEKVIIIDPITKIKVGQQIWVDHQMLIDRLWQLAEEKLIAIVLVNHTNNDGFMAGGMALKRSSDTVYRVSWNKKGKDCSCYTPNRAYPNVREEAMCKVDLKLQLDKGRYATRRGVSFGFEFTHALEFICQGLIIDE